MLHKWMPIAILALLVACRPAVADLKVGDKAPDFSGLAGVDDKKHALADYKDAKAIVLVVTCNHCPVAKVYEDRLIELQKDYKGKGVQLIAVNVNKGAEDSLDKMKERSESKKFNFPYIFDPTQKIARDLGAKVTPHVFLLDRERKIAYIGAVDDNNNADSAKKKFLRDALDAVLEGKEPPQATTGARGCSVKYEK